MTTEIVAAKAHQVNAEVIACKMNIEANFLHLAKLLKQIRDENLYRALDHSTFESYLGDPEVGIKRSSAYKLICEYERYVLRLAVPETRLIGIGSKKLSIIGPVVEGDKEEWLGQAEALSASDLINSVRQARGKPPLSSLPAKGHISSGLSDLLKYKSYIEYVKDRPCIVCGAHPVDAHHFPQGRARTDDLRKVLPLCRACHQEYHDNPLKFTHDYGPKLWDYAYRLIFAIWETA
jgi:hypothetical protein